MAALPGEQSLVECSRLYTGPRWLESEVRRALSSLIAALGRGVLKKRKQVLERSIYLIPVGGAS